MIDYDKEKAINYSLLKEYYHSLPRAKAAWERMQEPKSPIVKSHFQIGTLVDMYLTEPHKLTESIILCNKIPSEKLGDMTENYLKLTQHLLELHGEDHGLDPNTLVLQARENVGYDKRLGDAKVIERFWSECGDYIEVVEQAKAEDKMVVTQETLDRAGELADTLANGEYTWKYFSDDYERFSQVEIFWSLNGVEFKNKLDLVLVNKESKQIILTDVKTYGGDFVYNYFEYSYWLQDIMYKAPFELFKENKHTLFENTDFSLQINSPNEELIKYMNSSAYVLARGFVFLTVDTTGVNVPAPFISMRSAIPSMNSFSIRHKVTNEVINYEGWWNKATELWRHISDDNWTIPIELQQNKCIML